MATVTFTDASPAGTSGILDAIQEMFQRCGLPPAATLDTGGAGRAGRAEEILDRVLARIMRQGWHTTIHRQVDLTAVDVGGGVFNISVPTNAFNIRTYGKDLWRRATERSGLLFNLFNGANTTDWESALVIQVQYSLQLSLSQMPQYLADYVIASAARHFNEENVDTDQKNKTRLRILRDNERDTRAAARNADLRESKANVNESEHARNIMGNRQGSDIAGILPSS